MALNATTLCQLWIITRKDGTIFRYTDHDVDVSYGGQTYVALNSQELSALEQKTDLSVDTLDGHPGVRCHTQRLRDQSG
jgi:hypothetical protein